MNTRTAWIVYTVLRLAFFAAPFALLMLIGWPWWLAAVTATLVAVSLSMIFLAKPREAAAESIYDWRTRDRTPDDIAEDAAIDAEITEAENTAAENTSADNTRAGSTSADETSAEGTDAEHREQ